MDITAVGDSSKEALFAEMMMGSNSPQLQPHPAPSAPPSSSSNSSPPPKVEKRRNKRRDVSKQRPVSMSTYPSGSSYSIPSLQTSEHSPLMKHNLSIASISALGSRGFPFAKPKAFFSSEQHLPGRVESYNRSRDGLFQLKAETDSQVSK